MLLHPDASLMDRQYTQELLTPDVKLVTSLMSWDIMTWYAST